MLKVIQHRHNETEETTVVIVEPSFKAVILAYYIRITLITHNTTYYFYCDYNGEKYDELVEKLTGDDSTIVIKTKYDSSLQKMLLV